ncbi:hypothetical protein HAX54_024375 [Datura stramonium]|uniref:Uncharacterized protein n=1 Tax=Datura stramonium TaxID=4076 RepID=A0ABS8UXT9_DATST|nr:hypothetical protein [Datura stramonium]
MSSDEKIDHPRSSIDCLVDGHAISNSCWTSLWHNALSRRMITVVMVLSPLVRRTHMISMQRATLLVKKAICSLVVVPSEADPPIQNVKRRRFTLLDEEEVFRSSFVTRSTFVDLIYGSLIKHSLLSRALGIQDYMLAYTHPDI